MGKLFLLLIIMFPHFLFAQSFGINDLCDKRSYSLDKFTRYCKKNNFENVKSDSCGIIFEKRQYVTPKYQQLYLKFGKTPITNKLVYTTDSKEWYMAEVGKLEREGFIKDTLVSNRTLVNYYRVSYHDPVFLQVEMQSSMYAFLIMDAEEHDYETAHHGR